jgi:uncharacterized protein (TIGR03083 family)
MRTPKPIFTVELFPELERKLIELLRCLRHDEWSLPTLAKQWTVRDVAAHLLDGNLKRLSMQRDGFFGSPAPQIESYETLIAFINRNNAEWVQAARRLSPPVLTELLETTSKQVCDFFRTLDPFAPALWSVAWAGERQSANWFDVAREYTERWHHQQQIREAVNRPGITGRELYFPVLDTFMRGLPHAFRSVTAPQGTTVEVKITGEAGGAWWIERADSSWKISELVEKPEAVISIDQELAWKVFTKAIDAGSAAQQVQLLGDRALGLQVLSLVAVLA